MGKPKIKISVLLRDWVSRSPNPKIFTIDGEQVYCQACSKSYCFKQRSQFLQHLTGSQHQKNEQKFCLKPQKQPLISTSNCGKNEFFYDVCEAFVSAGIPWKKLQNKKFREMLEKYTKRSVPDESTLRKNYNNQLYLQSIKMNQDEVGDNPVWLQIDETTDVKGRYMANVLIGAMRSTQASPSHLILVKQLERTNHSTIAQTVLEALEVLWPEKAQEKIRQRFLLFLTDGAAYMLKAGHTLKATYPDLIHVTCMAHALHLIAEKVRSLYPNVDKLVSSGKATFRKAPSRVVLFKEMFPELNLPPAPVITRWGTWLDAVVYYQKNLPAIVAVLGALDETDANCISQAKTVATNPTINGELDFIVSNFTFISECIKRLETSGLSLNDSADEINKTLQRISTVPGSIGKSVLAKLNEVLLKNHGFREIFKINEQIAGKSSINENLNFDPIIFKFAPITTVDTERSFSIEKWLIDGRESLKPEAIGKLMVSQYELSISNKI